MFLNKAQEPPFLEQAIWYSSMHMGGSSIVPRTSTTCYRFLRSICLNAEFNHLLIPGLWLFPLPPQELTQSAADPLIQGDERLFYLG